MNTAWDAYVVRARARWGERLDLSAIDRDLLPYFRGPRVRLEYREDATETLAGTIGVTTGWKPILLLIRRSSDVGSSDTLSPGKWRVTAVKRGREYVPVRVTS